MGETQRAVRAEFDAVNAHDREARVRAVTEDGRREFWEASTRGLTTCVEESRRHLRVAFPDRSARLECIVSESEAASARGRGSGPLRHREADDPEAATMLVNRPVRARRRPAKRLRQLRAAPPADASTTR